jgi:hypothetical protein
MHALISGCPYRVCSVCISISPPLSDQSHVSMMDGRLLGGRDGNRKQSQDHTHCHDHDHDDCTTCHVPVCIRLFGRL